MWVESGPHFNKEWQTGGTCFGPSQTAAECVHRVGGDLLLAEETVGSEEWCISDQQEWQGEENTGAGNPDDQCW